MLLQVNLLHSLEEDPRSKADFREKLVPLSKNNQPSYTWASSTTQVASYSKLLREKDMYIYILYDIHIFLIYKYIYMYILVVHIVVQYIVV